MAGHLGGAESQIRTGDTAIFSRVLYQLSYLAEPGESIQCAHHGSHKEAASGTVLPLLEGRLKYASLKHETAPKSRRFGGR